jgi:hypothetical protein
MKEKAKKSSNTTPSSRQIQNGVIERNEILCIGG